VTHSEHHNVIVFPRAVVRIPERNPPTWLADRPHVNLVLDAHHPQAQDGQVLLVGQNEPDGSVLGDQAQLSVLRFRPARSQPAPQLRTAARRVREIPVEAGRRTVVYSLELDRLEEGEQLFVRLVMPTSAAHLGYPARISTRVFLADTKSDEDPGGQARAVGAFRGQISKLNGFNCLPSKSPCTTRKAGALSILRSAERALFVNVVAVSSDPFGGARPGDALRVLEGGVLEVTRYPASARG
jgi:hypothetical protein